MNPTTVLWIYIAFLVLGGLMGFLKAKSKMSLIMSLAFAIPLALCALNVLTVRYLPEILIGFLLGMLASVTGIALAVAAQFFLTKFMFKIGFSVPVPHLVIAMLLNSALAVVVGLLASRSVLNRPPLEVLRAEG